MPYYLMPKGTTSEQLRNMIDNNEVNRISMRENGQLFNVKADARSACSPDQTVIYNSSSREWSTIERNHNARMRGDGFPVPWTYTPFYYHLAHLRLEKPGFVYYFESEEKAHLDRSTQITPGRYLTRFMADRYTATQIAEYVAAVTADAAELLIATTAEDISRIYSGATGFTSCMQRKACAEYDWQKAMDCGKIPHPAVVYAGMDLAVAYRGPLDAVTQRAVVWPEKKSYQRIYGSGPLEQLLRRAGYQPNGIAGARVRAIEHPEDGYLMPYLDGVSCACVVRATTDTDAYILLDNDGPLDCQNTTGSTSDIPAELEMGTCSNCQSEQPEDEMYDDLCSSCHDERWRCADCRAYYIGDDNRTEAQNGYTLCTDCADSRQSADSCDCSSCRQERGELTDAEQAAQLEPIEEEAEVSNGSPF